MNRLVVVTVGKTQSGKTTFARSLEAQLHNSVVIDQDNHAAFINAHYKSLRPKEGPNTLKYAVTQTIVDYAVNQTEFNLILCNSNLARKGRTDVLDYVRGKGFMSILIYFDIPDEVLQARVAESRRSKEIFRSASTFVEVLARQQSAACRSEMAAPKADEADHFFMISRSEDVPAVIGKIIGIAERL
ncbi:ATP-binding protein [Paenibacillus arenilitoris]|uniref:AAA family ATPase n=1 Tax=Paenibacillus arenilitoris TaxID=2772299 RepID=A0A927CS56_9BACL|nr:ATP-binding protein [Paenibacillus arenilitoris]MBD2870625.1 AAA family ATPase [Paenibacillus arenilitoris]